MVCKVGRSATQFLSFGKHIPECFTETYYVIHKYKIKDLQPSDSPTPSPLKRLTPPLREGSDMLGKVLFLFISYYLLFIVCYLIFLFNISLAPTPP